MDPLIWNKPAPPARQSLSRAGIVAAAIRVADAGGVAALTMAAVAKELGPYTAMALYRHVESKDGLIDLMLDEVHGEVPEPGAGDWMRELRGHAMAKWEMVRRHPWYARLVHTRPPLGPNTLRRTEAALTLLVSAGFDVPEALSYLAMLDRHICATAAFLAEEEAAIVHSGIAGDDVTAAIRDLSATVAAAGDFPLLLSWMARPSGPDVEEQLVRGLDFLLAGIAGRLPG